MLLAALVSTKSQAVEAAKHCETQAHAGHETARISFRPPKLFFGCCGKRPSSGGDSSAVSALWKKYDTSAMAMGLRHSAV
jgi:hypothetical protein